MEKSAPSRSIGKTQTESGLTQLEMEVALQLIQLSGDSAETGGGAVEHSRDESVGDTHHEISSDDVKISELEALPRRVMRTRLLDDVYGFPKPVIKKRVKKSIK